MELERKTQLKADFKTEFNKDSYGGFGAAKNDAIAHAAFKNPEVFARITGVPEFIIKACGGCKGLQARIFPPHHMNPLARQSFPDHFLSTVAFRKIGTISDNVESFPRLPLRC